jgi:fibro-slime domain-containing protein
MKIPTPLNALSLLGRSLGLGLFVFSTVFAATTPKKKYEDTIWIPVIFYDFHPNTYNDFEMCLNAGGAPRTADNPQGSIESPGMVENKLSADRKPTMATEACKSPASTFPCACGLNNWFRPSGIGSSTAVKFEQIKNVIKGDTVKTWKWSGLTKSTTYSTATDSFFVGPSWRAADTGANLVYYSSLPFVITDTVKGIYTFDRRKQNTPFFWLDGKGFGEEPARRGHNFGFTMELHHEFTYEGGEEFNFSGDDDVWVFINNQLVIDLGGVHNEMRGNFRLDEIATKYGLVQNQKYFLDVFYAERHTTESNCLITTNLIRPTIKEFKIIAKGDTLVAGDTMSIAGIITNKADERMLDLEDSIRWEIVPPTVPHPNDRLVNKKGRSNLQGDTILLTATKAHRFIYVSGWVYDPYTPENIKSDTIPIWVIPAKDHHIVIEADSNPDPNVARPQMSVNIIDTQNISDLSYAVVRDTFDNLSLKKFTSPATVWTSLNTNIATVTGESGKAYHGIEKRVNDGKTIVVAADGNLRPDSVDVTVSKYYYDSLRLVDIRTGKVVDTLKIETDSIGYYKIQGLKSIAVSDPKNPNSWEDCQGKVELFDTLKSALPLTEYDNTWDYSPTNHGRGRVLLTNPKDTRTKKTTIPVIVILSKPKIYLEILTTPDKLIAGDTIIVEASIKNDDGYIPIPYCFGGKNADITDSMSYFDNLGRGGASKPEPFTIVNDKVLLNYDNDRYRTGQCFKNGRDTFGLVLFYAPFDNPIPRDSLHILSLIAGTRRAETKPFKLLPGPLYTLKFEDQNFIQYQDPQYMNPEDQVFSTYANGYDKYGNRRGAPQGHEFSEWSVTGDLDTAKLGDKFGEKNTYTTHKENYGLTGKLVAKAKGIHDSIIVAEITLIVKTPPSTIESVYTRDISGNGLLDRIDLTFNKRTKFSQDEGNISIANVSTHTQFSIDSVVSVPNSGDSVYYIYLHETDTTKPQTAWTPTLILNGFAEAENVSGEIITDGAAPVVWKAKKYISESLDPSKDIVTITLSEPIETGGSLGLVTVESNPPDVFRIWEKVGDKYEIEDLLKGIDNFSKINEETFEFTMKNGLEITDRNYVNIYWEHKQIADENSNFTHERNQKVKFTIEGNTNRIDILPNPARPTAIGEPGRLEMVDLGRSDAYKKAKNGGAIIRITVVRPSDTTALKLTLKVYDVVGNQVIWSKNDNVFKGRYNTDTSNIVYLYYYWNCTNARGMKVAPGRYKFIGWFDYNSPLYKDEKIGIEMGVKK